MRDSITDLAVGIANENQPWGYTRPGALCSVLESPWTETQQDAY